MGNFYTNCRLDKGRILIRAKRNGKSVSARVKYSPSLFFRDSKNANTGYKTIHGEPLIKRTFDNVSAAYGFINENKDVTNYPIYGYTKFEYMCLQELFPTKVQYDISELKILNFDLEVSSDNGFPYPEKAADQILSVAVSLNGKMYLLALGEYTPDETTTYIRCDNERHLIQQFFLLWRKFNPDIITGYAIANFDIPYLINRTTILFSSEYAQKISPWEVVKPKKLRFKSPAMKMDIDTFDIYGVEILDYMLLFLKFNPNMGLENYKLDTVAEHVLGERKLDYSVEGSLNTLYKTNYQKFLDYNVQDTRLIDKLEDNLKLISLAVNIAYDAKINYSDVFYQTRIWENIFYCHLIDKKIIFPPPADHQKLGKYRGAFVKPIQTGVFNHLVSYDLNSLYPSLIVQNNISPDTILPNKIALEVADMIDMKNVEIEGGSLCGNGKVFSNEFKGFIPEVLEGMISERAAYKNKQIEYEKLVEEISERIAYLESNHG